MMRVLESIWLVLFLAGLLCLGVLGTWAETAPFWYGAAFVGLAGVGAVASRQSEPGEKVGWGPILVMLVMTGYLGWRGFQSPVRWLARQDLVFMGTALVAYGLVAVRFTTWRARVTLLVVLVVLVAGNAGLGLYQYFEDPRMNILRGLGLKRAPEVSAGGFFESSNHFAGFMTLAGLPLLGVALMGGSGKLALRVLCGIGFLLAGTGVVFSTSRGGIIGFFFGCVIFLLISLAARWIGRNQSMGKSNARALWGMAAAGVVFAAMLAGAGMTLRKFFGEGKVFASLNARGSMWDAALEQWQSSPLIGTGARSYEYMERGFRTLETQWIMHRGEVDAFFAHNDYLQTLGDYGLVGLFLVLLTTAVHGWAGMRNLVQAVSGPQRSGEASALAGALVMGSVAAIAGLMVQAVVEFNLHIGINAVMTGLLLGFLATPGYPVAAKPLQSPQVSPPPRKALASLSGRRLAFSALLAGLSLMLINAGWKYAMGDFAYHQALKQVREASSYQDFLTASGTLQRATALDPLNAKAWALRGMVTLEIAARTNEKYSQPFYEASLQQLQQSLRLYPQQPYASAHAGKVAAWLGRRAEADRHFATALRWGLNIQSVNESYGDYLLMTKEYYKAVGYLVTALHLSSDAEIRNSLDLKIRFCRERLKKQGLTPPPEAFMTPATR